mmetsp:Transcript_25687/g.51306  ORF Transcript_25687/g.51306 Transcript_25687/m.51306 type:complete len:183 (-) Transcript_25687:90-638(-)|eukprot:CAMPEP_0182463866 /NCGR_PEP_ID=MMETSP1319-20130603/8030_2 /TAXON_ID=172717 /ORGANISM="Bolidomonas pacifica, Strain RCC208" /LENGTH=182 /DNA_ID=CAMNT_0024663455 /DNA_START=119 /DNA_END=667 /DNA_ORIENTATION=-
MAELHLIGSILGCSDFKESQGVYCKWSIITGEHFDWQILAGEASGCTQVDSTGGEGVDGVWDHPLDVHLGVTSMVGWPRLRVEVWSRDAGGSNTLCGYGFCNVPTSPGLHDIDIVTWVPTGGVHEQLCQFFLGIKPHLKDSSIVARTRPGESRFGLKCESSGVVYLQIEVITSNFEAQGLCS